jgi:hypothetical protein
MLVMTEKFMLINRRLKMDAFVNLLKNKEKQTWLNGNNVRLFWQDKLEGYTGVITAENLSVVSDGWHVITWNRSKPVTLYFGPDLDIAFEYFDANNH